MALDSNKLNIFNRLRNKLEAFIINELKINQAAELSSIDNETIIIAMRLKLKNKNIDDLAGIYLPMIADKIDISHVTDAQRDIVKRYIEAMLELV